MVFIWGGGTIISDAELHAHAASGRRYSSAAIGENQHILWSADYPDAGGPGGANHSCDSNLWMLDARTAGARRDIAAGEELTLDYALFSVAPEWRMRPLCSSLCRGSSPATTGAFQNSSSAIWGISPPFINARIAELRRTQSGSDEGPWKFAITGTWSDARAGEPRVNDLAIIDAARQTRRGEDVIESWPGCLKWVGEPTATRAYMPETVDVSTVGDPPDHQALRRRQHRRAGFSPDGRVANGSPGRSAFRSPAEPSQSVPRCSSTSVETEAEASLIGASSRMLAVSPIARRSSRIRPAALTPAKTHEFVEGTRTASYVVSRALPVIEAPGGQR